MFYQAEDGIRDAQESRGLGDVYKRQIVTHTGEKLELSLWIKKSKNDKNYFSVSVQQPYKKETTKTDPINETFGEDLPW